MAPPKPVRIAPEASDAAKRVVVYDLQDPASVLSDKDRGQLSALFRARLGERPDLQIVLDDRAQGQLAAEKRAALKAGRDEKTSVELGRVASATHAIRVEVLRLGNTCTLTAALYDLTTEARLASRTENLGCDVPTQRAGLERLAKSLGGEDRVTPGGTWHVASQTVTGVDRYSLTLVLDGRSLVGTNPKGARWEGRLDGRTYRATWQRGSFAGRMKATFSKDGKRLVGKYGLGDGALNWSVEANRAE